jgi:hypothetical protein
MSAVPVDGVEDEPCVCAGNCRTAEPLDKVNPPLKNLLDPLPLSKPLDPLPLPLPTLPLPLPLCPPLPLPNDPSPLSLLRHASSMQCWLVHGVETCICCSDVLHDLCVPPYTRLACEEGLDFAFALGFSECRKVNLEILCPSAEVSHDALTRLGTV